MLKTKGKYCEIMAFELTSSMELMTRRKQFCSAFCTFTRILRLHLTIVSIKLFTLSVVIAYISCAITSIISK